MIVRRFLQWAATAPAEARVEGAAALARAYLDRELDPAEWPEAEAAMMALTDDPAPVVRLALALEVAASPRAPHALVTTLAADRPDIAALPLEFSPLLSLGEMVDAMAVGDDTVQCAVARRAGLCVGLAAALAEVAGLPACVELCRNESAAIGDDASFRMLQRFGQDTTLRAAMGARDNLAPALRHELALGTARALAAFVTARGWLDGERAARTAADATEQACVIIAARARDEAGPSAVAALVRHLRGAGGLTPALILRGVLCGNHALVAAALSELAGLPLARVAGLLHNGGRGLGFRSLYDKAGLPAALRPVFAAALEGLAGQGEGGGTVLRRDTIGRVMAACRGAEAGGGLGSVMALLRRLDAQAAREQARAYAEDVMREPTVFRLPRVSPADRGLPLPSAA